LSPNAGDDRTGFKCKLIHASQASVAHDPPPAITPDNSSVTSRILNRFDARIAFND